MRLVAALIFSGLAYGLSHGFAVVVAAEKRALWIPLSLKKRSL